MTTTPPIDRATFDALRDAAGAEFGQDRVAELLRQGHALPMAALCERMLAALRDFSAGTAQADDITILLVRRRP